MSKRPEHPLAGQTVILNCNPDQDAEELNGKEFVIEDWWQNIAGKSWMFAVGNPTALKYAVRCGIKGMPLDDEVVYGKVGGIGHIVHVSELGEVVK